MIPPPSASFVFDLHVFPTPANPPRARFRRTCACSGDGMRAAGLSVARGSSLYVLEKLTSPPAFKLLTRRTTGDGDGDRVQRGIPVDAALRPFHRKTVLLRVSLGFGDTTLNRVPVRCISCR